MLLRFILIDYFIISSFDFSYVLCRLSFTGHGGFYVSYVCAASLITLLQVVGRNTDERKTAPASSVWQGY